MKYQCDFGQRKKKKKQIFTLLQCVRRKKKRKRAHDFVLLETVHLSCTQMREEATKS